MSPKYSSPETHPCQLCGEGTTFSKLCQACWEVDRNFSDRWHLRLSPLACRVADGWVMSETIPTDFDELCPGLQDLLNEIEEATDGSHLRKAKR